MIAFCFAQIDDVFLSPDFPGGHGPIPAPADPAATPGSRTCRIRLVRLWKSLFGAMIQSVAPDSNWTTRPTSSRRCRRLCEGWARPHREKPGPARAAGHRARLHEI